MQVDPPAKPQDDLFPEGRLEPRVDEQALEAGGRDIDGEPRPELVRLQEIALAPYRQGVGAGKGRRGGAGRAQPGRYIALAQAGENHPPLKILQEGETAGLVEYAEIGGQAPIIAYHEVRAYPGVEVGIEILGDGSFHAKRRSQGKARKAARHREKLGGSRPDPVGLGDGEADVQGMTPARLGVHAHDGGIAGIQRRPLLARGSRGIHVIGNRRFR